MPAGTANAEKSVVMNDTTQLEDEAEFFFASFLSRNNFLVAKPYFDQHGADLLCFSEFNDQTGFLRIQSKGRSLINSNTCSVEIPREYVTDFLVVLLYVKYLAGTEPINDTFCFFSKDLSEWNVNSKNELTLCLYKNTFQKKLNNYEFTKDRLASLRKKAEQAKLPKSFSHYLQEPIPTFPIYPWFPVNIITSGAALNYEYYPQENTLIKYQTTSGSVVYSKPCPGNPSDYLFDTTTDSWKKKPPL